MVPYQPPELPLDLNLTLSPMQTELIARRDLSGLVRLAHEHRPALRFKELTDFGVDLINQIAFISFLIGKKKAAQEVHLRTWTFDDNDLPALKVHRNRFENDFRNIMTDFKTEVYGQPDLNYYLRRIHSVAQMTVWTLYNQGKLELWNDKIIRRGLYQAAETPQQLVWAWITEADDRVCEECQPLAGTTYNNPMILVAPPLHFGCRCEIVAMPSKTVLSQQEAFREQFVEEYVLEAPIAR